MAAKKKAPTIAHTTRGKSPADYKKRMRALERRIETTSKDFIVWLQEELHMSKAEAKRLARISADNSRQSFMPMLEKLH